MKKKIVFGFIGLVLALFVGNFIGNDVKEAKASTSYWGICIRSNGQTGEACNFPSGSFPCELASPCQFD